jgi:hypothetical protein
VLKVISRSTFAELQRHHVTFQPRPPKMDRSVLYQETLPLFSSGGARLLDVPRLVNQYCALERRLMPGGWSRIDHPNRSGYHDDLANVCAGVLWRATSNVCIFTHEDMQPIIARAEAMGKYRRNYDHDRLPFTPGSIGERRFYQQMQWAQHRRNRY